MEKNRMTITLAGQVFRISSANDERYFRSLEEDINRRIKTMKARFPGETGSRCVLLAMLEMDDEVSKLRAESEEVASRIRDLRAIRDGEPTVPVKRPFERKKPTDG